MVSIENGVLKVAHKKENITRYIFEACFVANIICIFLLYSVTGGVPLMGGILFASALFMLVGEGKKKITIPYNTVWYAIFTLYASLSCLWVEYYSSSVKDQIIRLVVELIVITSISIYVNDLEDLERLMSLFIYSLIAIIVIEAVNAGPDRLFIGNIGSYTSGFNSNEIGFWVAGGEMMCFYKYYVKGQKRYLPIFVLFFVFVLLVSSRKDTIACIMGPVAMMLLYTYKKNYYLRILLTIVLLVTAVIFIMTDEDLYRIIGNRFDSMFEFMNTKAQSSDNSLYLRSYFIQVAKNMFEESPILGKGLRSFEEVLGNEYGMQKMYSHNNYWQLLSELGIVGFVLYYWFYVFCLVRLFKDAIRNKSRISIMFLTILLLIIGGEYGIVTYYNRSMQVLIAFIYTSTYVGCEDGRKYNYINGNTNEMEELN